MCALHAGMPHNMVIAMHHNLVITAALQRPHLSQFGVLHQLLLQLNNCLRGIWAVLLRLLLRLLYLPLPLLHRLLRCRWLFDGSLLLFLCLRSSMELVLLQVVLILLAQGQVRPLCGRFILLLVLVLLPKLLLLLAHGFSWLLWVLQSSKFLDLCFRMLWWGDTVLLRLMAWCWLGNHCHVIVCACFNCLCYIFVLVLLLLVRLRYFSCSSCCCSYDI